MIRKLFQMFVLTLLAYLLQVVVAPRVALMGAAPNIALAMIAVVTVCMGRKYTFIMSLAVGYLIEIMVPALDYMNLLLYPVCSMIGALFFADKSERKLEEERTAGKRAAQWNPHLRTALCAVLSTALFEGVHLFYTFLTGVALDSGHWGRALTDVFYTTALAGLFQFPIRVWVGTYRLKKAR